MSLQDVRARWGTYTSVTLAMFEGINDPQRLASAIPTIGPFPADRPADWGTWLNAFEFLGALATAVKVTDAALRQESAFVAAANEIAAKVRLPAPARADVVGLVAQLRIVNARIQQDQRFAAALAIGEALANQVQTQLTA